MWFGKKKNEIHQSAMWELWIKRAKQWSKMLFLNVKKRTVFFTDHCALQSTIFARNGMVLIRPPIRFPPFQNCHFTKSNRYKFCDSRYSRHSRTNDNNFLIHCKRTIRQEKKNTKLNWFNNLNHSHQICRMKYEFGMAYRHFYSVNYKRKFENVCTLRQNIIWTFVVALKAPFVLMKFDDLFGLMIVWQNVLPQINAHRLNWRLSKTIKCLTNFRGLS